MVDDFGRTFSLIQGEIKPAPAHAVGSDAALDMERDVQQMDPHTLDGMTKATALLYEHPDYRDWIHKWEKWSNLYAARDIYRYIFQHDREHSSSFDKRVRRGYYYNYVASIVDLIVSYLFSAPVERTTAEGEPNDEIFDKLYKDVDRKGTQYTTFLKMASTFANIVGHVGVLVDAPKVKGEIISRQDQEEQDLRAILTLVRAQQIKDWELDENGKFEWVKIEVRRPQKRDWQTSLEENVRYFQIWTKQTFEEWKVFVGSEDATNMPDRAEVVTPATQHPVGEVPLVIVRNIPMGDHEWFGESTVRDIADINVGILNWSSLGDEEIYERCLNILAMEQSGDTSDVIISENNVITYPAESHPPQYLTPGESPLKLIEAWIERAKDEIYRIAKLGGSTGLLGVREATSGIAYAFEFNETNQSLCNKAGFLEQAELDIHNMVMKWESEGQESFTGNIQYPREFGVDDFLTEFTILAEARNNFTSETAIQEVEKKVAAKFFSKDPEELRAKIFKEVEAAEAKPMPIGAFPSIPGAPKGGKGNLPGNVKPPSTDDK